MKAKPIFQSHEAVGVKKLVERVLEEKKWVFIEDSQSRKIPINATIIEKSLPRKFKMPQMMAYTGILTLITICRTMSRKCSSMVERTKLCARPSHLPYRLCYEMD